MVRKLFIFFGIVVFALYCWASVAYQNRIEVPGYKLVEVDLLHGMTREQWDAKKGEQFQHLMELETKKYQLPEDADSKLGISPNSPLASADFQKIIDGTPAGQPVKMKLRDSSAIWALVGKNYLLRDTIPLPEDPENKFLYLEGHSVDKEALDQLRKRGIPSITVSGHASPVNFQLGTALMITIIFFTLVEALRPILWEPFRVMLEKRKWELDMGSEAEKQAQSEKALFESEKRRQTMDLDRDIQTLRMQEQRETAKQAGAIVSEAREKGKELKLAGLRDIGQSAKEAHQKIKAEIPELAEAIANAVTPGEDNTLSDS